MSPDPMLAILYDLSQVISSEKRLQPLLKRILQRLLFHTSLPAGMFLFGKPGERMAECMAVVGEPLLAASLGRWLTVPDTVMDDQVGWLSSDVLRALCLSGRWDQALRLPIPGAGVFLLLLPVAARGKRTAMDALLGPAMKMLTPAVAACVADEQSRTQLSQDRDQARNDLALALRESEDRQRLLRQLSDTLPDMVWLKSMDGRYLFGNRALCDFVGLAEAELIGRNDEQLFEQGMASINMRQDMQTSQSRQKRVFEQTVTDPRSGIQSQLEVIKIVLDDDQGTSIGIMGIARDISERRERDRELRLAASVFVHAREGIMITAPDGSILDVNRAFCAITGYSRSEVLGKNPRILQSGIQDAAFYQQLWQTLHSEGHWRGELWNRRRNGEIFPLQMNISAVHDAGGQLQQYVALLHDVTEQKAYEQALRRAAHYDALTALPNRLLLNEIMERESLASRREGRPIAVAYLDLDGFKDINDVHGHSVGDRFLVEIARRLQAVLGNEDVLARIGGDEFIVLFNGVSSIDSALQRAGVLLPAVSAKVLVDGNSLQVTASIGLALDTGNAEVDAELLIRQADHAMYQAKLMGKNRCCLFEAETERALRSRQEQINEIREGLATGQFLLHYQPKVNMRTGRLLGVEALIRWQHPQRGLLMPDQFLPLIEQHELAVELGQWVIATALAQVAAWHASGLDVQVSVNIGARHLLHAGFLQELSGQLAAYPQLPPSLLQLEIVETSALEDIDYASALLDACRRLGASSAIDDFGTGYSSLSYLKRLPVQLLKVDKSFVCDILENPDDLAIMEGIIGLARAFDCEVIAEGVESVDHGILLLQLGCEMGQGYGIARPMPAAALAGWLLQWRPPQSWSSTAVTAPGEITVMRICIYLRAWMKSVLDYVEGTGQSLPEMDQRHCLFSRWLARSDTETRIAPALLQQIHEQHHRMHAMGQALVEAQSQRDTASFTQLHEQLRVQGNYLIDSLMQQVQAHTAIVVEPGELA